MHILLKLGTVEADSWVQMLFKYLPPHYNHDYIICTNKEAKCDNIFLV